MATPKEIINSILIAKDAEYNFETALRNKITIINEDLDAKVREKREQLPKNMSEEDKRKQVPDAEHYELADTQLYTIPENLGNSILFMVGVDIENTLTEPDDIAYYEGVITTVYQHNQDIETRTNRILSLAGDRALATVDKFIAQAKEAAESFKNSKEYKEVAKPENYQKVLDTLEGIVY